MVIRFMLASMMASFLSWGSSAWAAVYSCDSGNEILDSEHPREFTVDLNPGRVTCFIDATHIGCENYYTKSDGTKMLFNNVVSDIDSSFIEVPKVQPGGYYKPPHMRCQRLNPSSVVKKHFCAVEDVEEGIVMGEFNLEPLGAAAMVHLENKNWYCANSLLGIRCAQYSSLQLPPPYHPTVPIVAHDSGRFEMLYAEDSGKPYRVSCELTEELPRPELPDLEVVGNWIPSPIPNLKVNDEHRDFVADGMGLHKSHPLINVRIQLPNVSRSIESYLWDTEGQKWNHIASLGFDPALFTCGTAALHNTHIFSSSAGTFLFSKARGCLFQLQENPYRWVNVFPEIIGKYSTSVAINKNKLLVYGGVTINESQHARAYLLDLVTGETLIVSEVDMPAPDFGTSIVALGDDEFVVWGGNSGEVLNKGAIYNGKTNTWRPMRTPNAHHRITQWVMDINYYPGTGKVFSVGGLPTFWGGWSHNDGFSTALSFYDTLQDQWRSFDGVGPTLPLMGDAVFANSDQAVFAHSRQVALHHETIKHGWIFDVAKNKWFVTPPVPEEPGEAYGEYISAIPYQDGFLLMKKVSDQELKVSFFKP